MRRRARFVRFMISASVLAAAWLLAAYMAEGAPQAAARMSEELEAVSLSPGSGRELTALSWSWKGQTVNLCRDGATGRWVNAEDAACPVDDARAEALARAAAEVTASMTVPDGEELERYGLASPALTVVTATESEIRGYDVGNMSVTGEYFLRVHGDDTVYLAGGALPTAFRVELKDLLALETVPEDMDAVTALSVQSEAGSYRIALDPEDGNWYRRDGEAPALLDEEGARGLYELLTELPLTDCVSWSGKPEDYGLRSPQAAGTVTYRDGGGEERSFTLEFGDYTEGGVYARFAGSAMVYRVPGTAADGLMYPRWEQITPTPVVTLEPGDIASLELTLDGERREIVRLEEEVERSVPGREDSVTVTDVIYSMNGWVLDTQRMEAWLESFSLLTAAGTSPAGEEREELFSVTFTWRDGESAPFTLVLRNYDSAHYLCLAGNERLLVPRPAADALLAQARSIFTKE